MSSIKGQIINNLDFEGHKVSVAAPEFICFYMTAD